MAKDRNKTRISVKPTGAETTVRRVSVLLEKIEEMIRAQLLTETRERTVKS